MRKIFFKFSALFALLLLLGGLVACETATTENYDAGLNMWVGQSERDLLIKWGIPDRQYKVDANTKLIAYKSHRQIYYPGTYPACTGGGRRFGYRNCSQGFPPEVQYLTCETTFTSVSGRISQWQHTGNDCVR